MSKPTNKNRTPALAYALEQLKLEIAQELGIPLPSDGYYGHMTSQDVGYLGGNITKRLVKIAEEQLSR